MSVPVSGASRFAQLGRNSLGIAVPTRVLSLSASHRAGFFFFLAAGESCIGLVLSTLPAPIIIIPYGMCCMGGLVFLFEKEKLQTAVPPRNSSEVRKLGVWGEPWLDARTYYPCRQSPRVFPCNSAAQNACLPLWCTTASLGNGRASG